MTPFRRGKFWSLYVPRRSGGVVQRATGTTDPTLARRMGRMIDTLADQRRWDVLEAIDQRLVTVADAWDAYCGNALEDLLAKSSASLVVPYIDRWLATLRQAPRTMVSYEQKVRTLLPEELRTDQLTAGWVTDRLAQLPHGAPTVRQYAHALSLFCKYLAAHRLLPENPVRDVPMPKGKSVRTVWKSEADDQRLVNAAHEPLRSYFALVHATGAERDAALVMRRRDLSLADGTCHIPGTKTASRDRSGVPIEPWALPILQAHCRGLTPDAPLFPSLTRKIVNKAHQEVRNVVGLKDYQLRDARHSYAVRAVLRGEPIWRVSKWLGHANIAITAQVYARFGLTDAESYLAPTASPVRATSHATSARF